MKKKVINYLIRTKAVNNLVCCNKLSTESVLCDFNIYSTAIFCEKCLIISWKQYYIIANLWKWNFSSKYKGMFHSSRKKLRYFVKTRRGGRY